MQPEVPSDEAATYEPADREPEYQAIVDRSDDPIIILNRSGRICFMNPAAQNLLDNDLQTRLETHFNKRSRQRAVSQVTFPREGSTDIILNIRLHHITWLGKPAVLVLVQDVSLYVSKLESFRESNRRYIAVLNSIPSAVYVRSLNEHPTKAFVNPAFQDMLRYPESAWREDENLWRKFIHGEDRASVCQRLAESIASNEPFSADYRLLAPDDEVMRLREEARVVSDERGKPSLLCGILRDVTEEKRAEAALNNYCERLERETVARGLRRDRVRLQLQQEISQRELAAAENKRLQQEIADSERREGILRLDCEKLEEQLQIQVADLKKVSRRLQHGIAERKRLEAQNREFQQQDTQNKQAREENARLREKLAESERKGGELKASLDQIEKAANEHAAEIKGVREQIEHEASRRQQAEEENTRLSQLLAEFRGQAEDLGGTRDDLEKQLKELNAELEQRHDELQQNVARREQAEKEIAQLREEIADRSRRESEQGKEHASKLEEAGNKLGQIESECGRVHEENERLREDTERARRSEEELRRVRDGLEEQVKKRTAELDGVKEQLERESSQREQIAGENLQLRDEIAEFKRTQEEVLSYHASLETWADELSAELERAREQLRQRIAGSGSRRT